MVELNASCLVLTVAALLVPIEVIEECRGHLRRLGRGSRSEGTDETALGSDERGSQLSENARKSPLQLWVPALQKLASAQAPDGSFHPSLEL